MAIGAEGKKVVEKSGVGLICCLRPYDMDLKLGENRMCYGKLTIIMQMYVRAELIM